MPEPPKPPRRERRRHNLLEKAQTALVDLVETKDAERASGRFGVAIVRDQSGHTGIRLIIDEAVYVD